MPTATPMSLQAALEEGYLRYFDTAFWLRDPQMMAERRRLVELEGVLFREPLLEAQFPYLDGDAITQACSRVGLSAGVADQLGRLIFDRDGTALLRTHQAQSLVTSLSPAGAPKPHVVVTSGTGSGKTECFLLPIFARLISEAEVESWPAPPPIFPWWRAPPSTDAWRPIRHWERRTAAVRAMVLYPTNALVEDQISRIRRAMLTATGQGAPRLFFGRYTGVTLGVGHIPDQLDNPSAVDVARQLQAIESELAALRPEDQHLRSQFSDPGCGEMLTRWDMIRRPPDILVTNTTMLNVMLMRDVEDPIFEATRAWLRDPSHSFTLVVDELHSYRGTQGTEVSLVVRNLLRRLGLAADSPQLRCIATSASLDGAEGLDFLGQFFGVSRDAFEIIPGDPRAPRPAVTLPAAPFAALAAEASEIALQTIATEHDVREALASACVADGDVRPKPLSQISAQLFGAEASPQTLEAALRTAGSQSIGSPAPLFRERARGIRTGG
jgi:DEAD/DEAH box helicase domain-containing protein